jgi:hypothetical protein
MTLFGTRMLTALAWANVVVHAAALILAPIGLLPGSPSAPLEERMDYLAGSPLVWSLGWSAFILCAFALVGFFAALAQRIAPKTPAASLAVIIAIAGGTLDLFCDAIYIVVLPRIASSRPPSPATFLAIEHLANVGGLVVANGMYALGVLMLTLCLRVCLGIDAWVAVTGYGTFGFGMILVAAGLLNSPRLAELATGPTLGLYCLWTVLAARCVERAEGRS